MGIAGLSFRVWSIQWTASNSTGRAGMVFAIFTVITYFLKTWALVNGRFEIITIFFNWLFLTVYASIVTAGHVGGIRYNNTWPFGFLWTGWCLFTVYALIGFVVNFSTVMKAKTKSTVMPSLRDLF